MSASLVVYRWIEIGRPLFAVSLSNGAQLIAVGSEQGASVYDMSGRLLLGFPTLPQPVHQLALQPDEKRLIVAGRQGWLAALDLLEGDEGFSFHADLLPFQAENDLNSLSVSDDGALIAIGHVSQALALLDAGGKPIWRRHPDLRNATDGQIWATALCGQGTLLYVGSAGMGVNRLASLDAYSAHPRGHTYLNPGTTVTALAAFPKEQGVAVAISENSYSWTVKKFDASLAQVSWERSFNEPVTALAADRSQPLLVVAAGYDGQVNLLDARSGSIIAKTLVRSVVNALSMAQGRWVAAAAQDGSLALLQYQPEEFAL